MVTVVRLENGNGRQKKVNIRNTVNSRVGDTLWVFSKSVANAGGRPGESFEQQHRTAGSLEKRSLTRECR